jgi:hypothetical protein
MVPLIHGFCALDGLVKTAAGVKRCVQHNPACSLPWVQMLGCQLGAGDTQCCCKRAEWNAYHDITPL